MVMKTSTTATATATASISTNNAFVVSSRVCTFLLLLLISSSSMISMFADAFVTPTNNPISSLALPRLFAESDTSKRTRRKNNKRSGGDGPPPPRRGEGRRPPPPPQQRGFPPPGGPPPGGPPGGEGTYNRYPSGGNHYDYSDGNLKFGTGKYTSRNNNDGLQSGVNLSNNGRSMQDNVYRQDRQNVDRINRGPGDRRHPQHRGMEDDFEFRIDELERNLGGMSFEDMPPGGGRGDPRGGRMDDEEDYGMDDYGGGGGARDRMNGGRGLLRDMHIGGRDGDNHNMNNHRNDNFGYQTGLGANVMGNSSRGRSGGYSSNQRQMNDLSNERRYDDYGVRIMDEEILDDTYIDEQTGRRVISGRHRNRRNNNGPARGGNSNFDRNMGHRHHNGRNNGRNNDDYYDNGYDSYEYDEYYM